MLINLLNAIVNFVKELFLFSFVVSEGFLRELLDDLGAQLLLILLEVVIFHGLLALLFFGETTFETSDGLFEGTLVLRSAQI